MARRSARAYGTEGGENSFAGVPVGDGLYLRGEDEPATYPVTVKVTMSDTHPVSDSKAQHHG